MDENKPMREKDFARLFEAFARAAEVRDKSISEIEAALDRIKPEQKLKEDKPSIAKNFDDSPAILNVLGVILTQVHASNDRLIMVSNRLNEMV